MFGSADALCWTALLPQCGLALPLTPWPLASRQVLVPTLDTVRCAALMEACIGVNRSVLLTGVPGE